MNEAETLDTLRQFGEVSAFKNELGNCVGVRMSNAVMTDDEFRMFQYLKELREVQVISRDSTKRPYTQEALRSMLARPSVQHVNLDYQCVNLKSWDRNVPAKVNERLDALWSLGGLGEAFIDLDTDGDVKCIRMFYSRITNQDFCHFPAFKSLRYLSVARSRRYSDDAVRHLTGMTTLEVLSLECVSHDAWRRIRRALPATRLIWGSQTIGPEEAEFSYQGEVTGYFDKCPCEPGQYQANFYGPPSELYDALVLYGTQPRCRLVSDPRRTFAVINWHPGARLDLDDFQTEE